MAVAEKTYPLSEEQIAFYQENGYIQINDVFSQEELDEISALTDEINERIEKTLPPIEERTPYQQAFLQVVNVWREDERFRKFTFHPVVGDIARRLMRADHVRLWHDHLMTKLPGNAGRATDWHQDFPYWPMTEGGPMSVWIPMQDVGLENGCMHFVPKSHDWNLREVVRIDIDEHADIFDAIRDKRPEEVQRVYCPLKRGSVTFHNGLTIHYAGKNLTDQPRKVFSVIYMPDGQIYNGEPHRVVDEAGYMKKGEAFHGEYFPVIV
jgi:ectoine hydroxylase-related dioxygenase (phytanoyl-CoA dioxygenase family)